MAEGEHPTDERKKWKRPAEEEIRRQFRRLLADPLLSISSLRSKAIKGQIGTDPDPSASPACYSRSVYWKIFLGLLPPPPSPSSSSAKPDEHPWCLPLSLSRSEWDQLRDRFLRAPDGKWVNDSNAEGEGDDVIVEETPIGEDERDGRRRGLGSRANSGFGAAGVGTLGSGKGKSVMVELGSEGPLGVENGNPWQAWFADLALRGVIRQDVERTFPDEVYFRQRRVQDMMTNVLFVFAKLNPDVGYRQGMHELLAIPLQQIDLDSLPSISSTHTPSANVNSIDQLADLALSRSHVEHDSWSLFKLIMRNAKTWYDFNPSVPLPQTPSSSSALFSSGTLMDNGFPAPNSRIWVAGGKESTLVQPIVAICMRIQGKILRKIDPEVVERLDELQIEPQIWGIRWIRLMFGREFPMREVLTLWDAIFAEDPSLGIVEHLCVAMLLRIRDALLASDYSSALQLLLRYPALRSLSPDNQIPLLVQQALFLRDNQTPLGGLRIRNQNDELGAVAGEGTGREKEKRSAARRSQPATVGRAAMSGMRAGSPLSPSAGGIGSPGGSSFFVDGTGLVNDLAKGVLDRAEAFGINRALFGTFGEVRRGIGSSGHQSSASMSSTSTTSPPRSKISEIPSKPPWEPRAPRDYVSEIARSKANNAAMGNAIGACVEALEKGFTNRRDTTAENGNVENETTLLLALTALRHIRDVMVGTASSFDPQVMGPLTNSSFHVSPAPPSPLDEKVTVLPTPPPPAGGIQGPSMVREPSTSTSGHLSTGPVQSQIGTGPSGNAVSLTANVRTVSSPLGTPLLLGGRDDRPRAGLPRVPQGFENLPIRPPQTAYLSSSSVPKPSTSPSAQTTSLPPTVPAGIQSRFPPSRPPHSGSDIMATSSIASPTMETAPSRVSASSTPNTFAKFEAGPLGGRIPEGSTTQQPKNQTSVNQPRQKTPISTPMPDPLGVLR